MQRGGDSSAAGDESGAVEGVDGHNGCIAQKPAEIGRLARLLAGNGDDANSGRLIIDHADGSLVRNNA